jgi:hypothetical protein
MITTGLLQEDAKLLSASDAVAREQWLLFSQLESEACG